jgi:hypothetical protein
LNRSDSTRGVRHFVLAALCLVLGTLPPMIGPSLRAQIPAVKFDVRAAKGLLVSPVYEGWYEVDGTKYVLFGYSNRNLEEVVDIPIGPHNQITPGLPDQGQPTRFFPGITYGVFAVAVPKDRPTTEVTWTLEANGQALSVPASLGSLYVISPQRENGTAFPGNLPPVLKFDPAGASVQGPLGMVVSRTATVSRPLTLDVWVSDDGLPPARSGGRPPVRPAGRRDIQGMTLGWQVYRAAGAVTLSNPAPPIEKAKASTTATFSQPGEYMLHVLAIDSRSANRCCWTNGYVKVTVEAGERSR